MTARTFAWIAATALLLSTSCHARAQADDPFCNALDRLMQAAHEAEPFASIRTASVTVPGIRQPCWYAVPHGPRVMCRIDDSRPANFDSLVAHATRCLGQPFSTSGQFGHRRAFFRQRGVYVGISEDQTGYPRVLLVHTLSVNRQQAHPHGGANQ